MKNAHSVFPNFDKSLASCCFIEGLIPVCSMLIRGHSVV